MTGDREPDRDEVPHVIVADPRKFSEYVLQPANADGKDHVFIKMLGYRSGSEEDARVLATAYVAQARECLMHGAYTLGSEDKWGRRLTIEIELKGLILRSGWLLRPDGTLWLATPFAGFAPQAR